MIRLRDEQGLMLIELLVAMVMTTIVFGATLSVLDVFQNESRFDQLRNENQDTARTTLDRMSRQLRNVVAQVRHEGIVPGALELAEPYETVFETIDTTRATSGGNKTNAMRVRYCLNDSNQADEILWEQVQRWETEESPGLPSSKSCPDLTKGDWATESQVVQHITNRYGETEESKEYTRPLFTYSAKETPQILSVEAKLFININPGQTRPGETQLTSAISLRNANRVPIAEFTATEEGNATVRLNASASYDPDGLALTYKWWENEAELNTTSQQYVTNAKEPFKVGEKLKFKLEVTNPGKLSASTERTVTIK